MTEFSDEALPDRSLPEHVERNRAAWDRMAPDFVDYGYRAWASNKVEWGELGIPEEEVNLLPADLAGMEAVELGCGTGYVSSWLARRGAAPVGIDNSPAQLTTARRFQDEFGIHFPLHLGNAEATSFNDASFDLAISEYGASIWCDPYAWIPEAARILRPGGELVFLANGTLAMLCTNPDDEDAQITARLERPLFGMHRFDWADGSVEFHISHGEMIRLLRASGFEVLDLIELRPAADNLRRSQYVPVEWARNWPCEEVWKARKR